MTAADGYLGLPPGGNGSRTLWVVMTTLDDSAGRVQTPRLNRLSVAHASNSATQRATLYKVAALLVAVILWQAGVSTKLVDSQFVSSPFQVARAIPRLLTDPDVTHALATTGSSIGLAFVMGASLGIATGCALGLSALLRQAFLGFFVFLMSCPKAIFLPLFLVGFGLGTKAAVAFGVFESFFYVVVNVVAGFDLVEERHVDLATAFRASRAQRLQHVSLPAAAPGVFAGLWYGIKHAFLGVLIMELFASSGGVGQLIRQYTDNLQTDKVMALVLLISVTAVLVGSGWNLLERRVNKWRPTADQELSLP